MIRTVILFFALLLAGCAPAGTQDDDDDSSAIDELSITNCEEACARIAECHGFVDEQFGQDEASCNEGCDPEQGADMFSCLEEATCDVAATLACNESGD
jgi:hypothetical protein